MNVRGERNAGARWPVWVGASLALHAAIIIALAQREFAPAAIDSVAEFTATLTPSVEESAPAIAPVNVTPTHRVPAPLRTHTTPSDSSTDIPAHDGMDAGGTSPRMGEGRTMPERLSRATHGAVAEAGIQKSLPASDAPAPAHTTSAPAPSLDDTMTASNGTEEAPLDANLAHDAIARVIRLSLDALKEYPYLARLRGMEGTVTLAMHVNANGTLEQIHVQAPSAYRVLDDAALKAARKIPSVPNAHELLHGTGIDVTVPVIYQLNEG